MNISVFKALSVTTGVAIVALATGLFIGRGTTPADGDATAGDGGSDREILYWVAPMDPNFRRDEPGKSPMGMDLVPVYADEVDSRPGAVSIDPTVAANLGVRTAPAARSPLPRRIEAVAYVAWDEDTMTHVHTRVSGWIERLTVKAAGDPVSAGQLLFELYSPDIVNAQQEYVAALQGGSRSLVAASRDRLIALGVSERDIERLTASREVHRLIRVFAEAGGVVTALGVREGMYVTPATHAISIAQLDSVWMLVEVFERQADWVRKGQRADVALESMPERRRLATVDYVYPELDPKTRTLTVRLRLDNDDGMLRPGMFGNVEIVGKATGEVVHVPREAVIRGGRIDRVVVAIGDGRFDVRPVKTGIESGDRVAILDGVSAGESVVVSGQFLIDSESNLESALSRFESGDGDRMQHDMDHAGQDMNETDGDGMDHAGHDMNGDAGGERP